MTTHATCPYRTIPDHQRWNPSFSGPRLELFNPHFDQTPKFKFGKTDRVATAGSCFAQNISRRLSRFDYNFLCTEYDKALSQEENEALNNSMFSARYGNIYTTLHLAQLFERAYGLWQPKEDMWEVDGRFYDPFRPSMAKEGFASAAELQADRAKHLRAIRQVFETADVFVLTLGLTEAWVNREDGAAYPICPGCGYGTFDAEKYAFKNFSVEEVVEPLERFLRGLFEKNPAVKVILTVSPVPLAATMENRHVLTSTVYSKSALRVAADIVSRNRANIDYFASYEIVNYGRGMSSYFAGDLRTVADEGVNHVMRIFFKYFCDDEIAEGGAYKKAWCDEDALTGAVSVSAKPLPPTDPAWIYNAKKWQVSQVRHPDPFTTWKGQPHDTVEYGRKLDANGYYNSRNIRDFMGPEWKRVCVIGSSVIMELQQDEENTICGVMQREFAARGMENVFVYNCGIHRSVTSQDLSNLVHYVLDFKPTVVVALTGSNDFHNAATADPRPRYPANFFVWEKILTSFRMQGLPPNIQAYLEEFSFDLEAIRKDTKYASIEWRSEISNQFQSDISKMMAICMGLGTGIFIINQPDASTYRIDGEKLLTRGAEPYPDEAHVVNGLERSLFFTANLAPCNKMEWVLSRDWLGFFDDAPTAPFVDRIHMTKEGYARISKTIVDDMLIHFPERLK